MNFAQAGARAVSGEPAYETLKPLNEDCLESMEKGEMTEEQAMMEKIVRVGFIRKVYGILSFQLLLTVGMGATMMNVDSVREFAVTNHWLMTTAMVMSFVLIFALMVKKDEHPTNMYLLTAFTVVEAYTIGVVCATFSANGNGALILQAAGLTALVFCSLTAYTFTSKTDFSFMGAGLYSALYMLIGWGFFCWMFGFQPGYLYSLAGAFLFSMFIIYDTWLIMNKYGPDDYIMASIQLYLDIINLFLYILEMLSNDRS